MRGDNVRRLLWRWGQAPEACALMQFELDGLYELLDASADIQPVKLSGMPFGGVISDTTSDAASRLMELRKMFSLRMAFLQEEILCRQVLVDAMDEVIARLDVAENEVLTYRYRRGFNFPEICAKLRYSRSQVARLEGDAVDKLGRRMSFHPI